MTNMPTHPWQLLVLLVPCVLPHVLIGQQLHWHLLLLLGLHLHLFHLLHRCWLLVRSGGCHATLRDGSTVVGILRTSVEVPLAPILLCSWLLQVVTLGVPLTPDVELLHLELTDGGRLLVAEKLGLDPLRCGEVVRSWLTIVIAECLGSDLHVWAEIWSPSRTVDLLWFEVALPWPVVVHLEGRHILLFLGSIDSIAVLQFLVELGLYLHDLERLVQRLIWVWDNTDGLVDTLSGDARHGVVSLFVVEVWILMYICVVSQVSLRICFRDSFLSVLI